MLWERVGEDLVIIGDGVVNWRLFIGDCIGRLVGDWVRFWGVIGDGWSKVESWEVVIKKYRYVFVY